VCALRALSRQREMLLRGQGRQVQHMQKALTQMNLQLANVISDVAGETGQKILRAIVADAAGWAEARMILVLASGAHVPDSLPVDAVVFEAPDADPDGVFAALVGHFAAALDDGAEPGEAFRTSVVTDGWSGAISD